MKHLILAISLLAFTHQAALAADTTPSAKDMEMSRAAIEACIKGQAGNNVITSADIQKHGIACTEKVRAQFEKKEK